MIGIGLNDERDISVKGLETVKKCDCIYLENYTSKLQCSKDELEKFYGKKITIADRNLVEKKAEETILRDAKTNDVAFLVIGDVFGATTHIDLMLRAKKVGISVKVIHNASVLNAIGIVGLELYKYGKTTSIPFENKNVKTPIEVLKNNQKIGLHTLFLLDLDPQNNRFMTVDEALTYLLKNGLEKTTLCIGCAAVGSDEPEIRVGTAEELVTAKCQEHLVLEHAQNSILNHQSERGGILTFKKYPQCLIIPGKLHFVEEEALEHWKTAAP
jgi:diphthine synthase